MPWNTSRTDPASGGRRLLELGVADIRLGRPEGGERVRAARGVFEQLADHRMAIECLDWEAVALGQRERPEALEVAREALRRCRLLRPAPRPLEARIREHLGAIHLLRHEWTDAINAHYAAFTSRSRFHDLDRTARTHADLSLAYLGAGDSRRSVSHARRALAIQPAGDRVSLSYVEYSLGMALMRRGVPCAAGRHLLRSLQRYREAGVERGQARVLLGLGELRARRGDPDGAERLVRRAMDAALRLGECVTLASAHQSLALLRARRGDHGTADRSFRAALALLGEAGLRECLVECHVRYGRALEERGDLAGAVRHWKWVVSATRSGPAVPRQSV